MATQNEYKENPDSSSWTGTSVIIIVVVLVLVVGYFLLRGPGTPTTPNTGGTNFGTSSESSTTVNVNTPSNTGSGTDNSGSTTLPSSY